MIKTNLGLRRVLNVKMGLVLPMSSLTVVMVLKVIGLLVLLMGKSTLGNV